MCHKESSIVVHFKTMPAYQDNDLVIDIRVLHRVFWSYYPCIKYPDIANQLSRFCEEKSENRR
ncbi:hypothetical protein Ahy_B04g071211 isoform B [Arachis hypogaea]|uniref:Uncharacterized protein n=1 Tax=Arachis hypogaea TaxID=3818 RepID=A0A444ZK99_ARAHY|nr:hypothetical protein Ahy_B04g071211 isoform B [Arachis hypogaea]